MTLEDPIDHSLDGYDREDEDDDSTRALAKLPSKLVLVASQPIVRGCTFAAGGVSGNVRAVVRARRLVYQVLGIAKEDGADDGDDDMSVEYTEEYLKAGVERGEVPTDWEERVLGPESRAKLDDCVVKVRGARTVPILACPECGSAI